MHTNNENDELQPNITETKPNKIYYKINNNNEYYVNKYKKEQTTKIKEKIKSFLLNNTVSIF